MGKLSPEQEKAVEQIASEGARIFDSGKKPILIALDGRSGTSKSTLAKEIATRLNGITVESDDFFSGGANEEWAPRTPQEKAGEAIDWERLRAEALEPLLRGEQASWHPFEFEPGVGWVGTSDKTETRKPAPAIVLDGAYSARPELSDLIDLSVLVELVDAERRSRLAEREGRENMRRWHEIWDPAEDYYFTEVRPPESFDVVVKV